MLCAHVGTHATCLPAWKNLEHIRRDAKTLKVEASFVSRTLLALLERWSSISMPRVLQPEGMQIPK